MMLFKRKIRLLKFCLSGTLVIFLTVPTTGSTPASSEAKPAINPMSSDPHAGHHQMMQSKARYVKSIVEYMPPDVSVLDRHGNRKQFRELIASDSPLVLNFIFTSCTTVCPVLSATFSQAQNDLQSHSKPPIMVSVSIDPDYDTPERLFHYADKFHAGPNWLFLTGSRSNMLEIQKSFDAYRGDKLNHIPLTFIQASADSSWLRLEGFTSSQQLVQEFDELISEQPE
jgi:protein SCO1/2